MNTLPRKHIVIAGLGALALVLVGAIVGLLVTSGGGRPGSVRDLTLQPTDLPPEFALTEERLYSREELVAELPAEAQAAEEGLKEAVHLTYESQEDIPVVDVWVYAYGDESAAEAAHVFARRTDLDALRPFELGNGMRGHLMPVPAGLELDGLGDDAALMEGSLDYYDDGDEMTVGDSLTVRVFFIRSGSARAEVRVAGESLLVQADSVARNEYLRLEKSHALAAPRDP
jgi:hypothetical protein